MNKFINDPTHNTLQADLYDSNKAEVLGVIQSSQMISIMGGGLATQWNWAEGKNKKI